MFNHISSLKRNKSKRNDSDFKDDDSKRSTIRSLKNSFNIKTTYPKKDEDLKNEIIRKNPYLNKEQKFEKHISSNALDDLRKMSEKAYLRDNIETEPKKKTVKFSHKNVESYLGGLKIEKNDEGFKRLGNDEIINRS